MFRPTFLKSRGWDIMRIWSRDWWLHKIKTLNLIVKTIEKNRQQILKIENNLKSGKTTTALIKPVITKTPSQKSTLTRAVQKNKKSNKSNANLNNKIKTDKNGSSKLASTKVKKTSNSKSTMTKATQSAKVKSKSKK